MPATIAPKTHMGTVKLSVSNLALSHNFYTQRLGLKVLSEDLDNIILGGDTTPLLHLTEKPKAKRVQRATGLFHFALLVSSRLELGKTLARLLQTKTPMQGFSDHLVSEAIYLADPDGHGIEVYRDRPRDEWEHEDDGRLKMATLQMDIHGVLDELEKDGVDATWSGIDPQTTMGHVHLHVDNLQTARQFYIDTLGFEFMTHYPSALFISAGGYHHHLGLNTWAGEGVAPPPDSALKLESYEILLPDRASLEAIAERLTAGGYGFEQHDNTIEIPDPAHNKIILKTNS